MDAKLQRFYDQQTTPWMKLFYRLVYAQLPSNLTKKTILDFGAGFGWTANYLAGLGNQVLALEPNAEMLENRLAENPYEMRLGSLNELKKLPAESFDWIVCHNVLEYTGDDERTEILREFERLVKSDGAISIVKHNLNGGIMQRVVFENQTDEALGLLNGTATHSAVSFGQIKYYDLQELIKNLSVKIDKLYGLRTFFALQPNEFKTTPDWADKMFELEMKVAANPDFNRISFFQHVILKKR